MLPGQFLPNGENHCSVRIADIPLSADSVGSAWGFHEHIAFRCGPVLREPATRAPSALRNAARKGEVQCRPFCTGLAAGYYFRSRSIACVWNCCRLALLDFLRLRMQNPGMPDENSQRLDKLESHVAHLEHQVEQLNGVVIEQGKLLDRLKKEVQRQSGFMQTLELERMKSNVQKPPHYQ